MRLSSFFIAAFIIPSPQDDAIVRRMSLAKVKLSQRQVLVGIIVFLWCLVATLLSHYFAPGTALVIPASAFGVAAIFLEGVWLWPAIYLGSLGALLIMHASTGAAAAFPAAFTLEAVLGGYFLRRLNIDPLFRSRKDSIVLLLAVLVVSALTPVAWLSAHGEDTLTWGERYMGTAFYLFLLTPFIMRWFAKPRFVRPWPEIVETAVIFLILIALDAAIFVFQVGNLRGFSLLYLLLVPLFWIALRLRPRFVTLALIVTAGFALYGLGTSGTDLASAPLISATFEVQAFLFILTGIFLTMTSLEEERRLSTNLLRSQLSTLENAVRRVSSESRAKNDFIAVLAHELRNPLAPIQSGIEFLRLSGEANAEKSALLATMDDRMQTVRRLLEDLLDISRIVEGKVSVKLEPTNLSAVLRRAILSTEHRFKNRHQVFEERIPARALYVMGDPVRLEQVFSNLLTNASKYSDDSDEISLSLAEQDGNAVITVADTGIGIPPETIQYIFLPFHQLDGGVRSTKGLGIGLALVKGFVEMHGGTIEARSEGPGKGSTFTVTFPLVESPEKETQPVKGVMGGLPFIGEPKHATKGPSVLVVDDNDVAAWGIGKLLELRGCAVAYAYNGEDGIRKALSRSPAAVILDIGLPDMNGEQVAAILRTRGYKGRIVALSGFTAKEARVKKSDELFDAYLVKPAGIAELEEAMPGIV